MFCFYTIITLYGLSVYGPYGRKETLKRHIFRLYCMDFVQPKQECRHWSLRYKTTTPFQCLWNEAGNFLDNFITTAAMIRNGHTMKCALFLSLCRPCPHYFMFIYTMVSLSLPHYLLLPSVMNFSLVNFRFSNTTNFINAKHQFPITQFSPLFSRFLIAYSAFCRGNILSVQTSPGLTLFAVLP